jgi:hypothetical protein
MRSYVLSAILSALGCVVIGLGISEDSEVLEASVKSQALPAPVKTPLTPHALPFDLSEIDRVIGEWIPRPTRQRMLQSGIFSAQEVLKISSKEKAKVKAEGFHREALNQLNRELNLLSPHKNRLFRIRQNLDEVQARLSKINDNLFFYEVIGYNRVISKMQKLAGGESKQSASVLQNH